jgi:DNA primase small subunit
LRHTTLKSEQFRGWTERIASAVGYAPGQANRPRKSVAQAIASQAARIDSSVTTDVHRIFRLAGTLHGTSGMRKTRVNPEDNSDSTIDAVVLSDAEVKLSVDFYPTFSIKGREFGPYKSEVVMLPTYATIGILTRGLGEVV